MQDDDGRGVHTSIVMWVIRAIGRRVTVTRLLPQSIRRDLINIDEGMTPSWDIGIQSAPA